MCKLIIELSDISHMHIAKCRNILGLGICSNFFLKVQLQANTNHIAAPLYLGCGMNECFGIHRRFVLKEVGE